MHTAQVLSGWVLGGRQAENKFCCTQFGIAILDKFLLTVAVLPIAAAIGGFYYFEDYPQWMRVIALLVAVGISGLIALQTALGQTAWAFRRDAIIEVRKVVWPTRKETMQTTMIVLVVVIIMSLLLWALDSILAWIVRALTN